MVTDLDAAFGYAMVKSKLSGMEPVYETFADDRCRETIVFIQGVPIPYRFFVAMLVYEIYPGGYPGVRYEEDSIYALWDRFAVPESLVEPLRPVDNLSHLIRLPPVSEMVEPGPTTKDQVRNLIRKLEALYVESRNSPSLVMGGVEAMYRPSSFQAWVRAMRYARLEKKKTSLFQ